MVIAPRMVIAAKAAIHKAAVITAEAVIRKAAVDISATISSKNKKPAIKRAFEC